jgi:two-component system LytT family response regulator
MPDGNGFDVLTRAQYKKFEVIFITAFQEFAIQAIKFSALDYILKPIDMEELQIAVNKALDSIHQKTSESQFQALQNNIQPSQKRKIVLKTLESIHIVDIENIIRCEADKNYTSFFLVDGKRILVSKTLKDYDLLLTGHNFFRVQQSHLININFIERYDKHDGGYVVMKDGASVPLSPAKKDQFFQLIENL